MVKNPTPVSATPPVQISAEASSDSNQQRNPVPLPKISFELQPERQSEGCYNLVPFVFDDLLPLESLKCMYSKNKLLTA